jgi:hypothetical protein
VTYTGMTVAHLSGGKIVDRFTQWDARGLLEQLGVVPLIRKPDGSRL